LPLTNAQRIERFGYFPWRVIGDTANPERIRQLGGWPEREIVPIDLPFPFQGKRAMLNGRAVDSFMRLFEDWHRDGDTALIHAWNGGWAPRFKRQDGTVAERIARCQTLGAASLSNHAWGTAFDVNAGQWPLGRPCPAGDPWRRLSVRAYERGWFPGMDFRRRPDAMHFEFSPPKRIIVGVPR
jgi:hypothetical protein